MEFQAYRDLASLAFVRCISPIPGSTNHAEGVGFSLHIATEKCRSEVLERSFVRALPREQQSRILGVAAHPEEKAAEEHAWCESLETVHLEALAEGRAVRGLTMPLPGRLSLHVSRTDGRWITLLSFPHDGARALVQAASKTLWRALLRTWTEFRNLKIYRPSAAELSRYTKGNRILGDRIASIKLKTGLLNVLGAVPASIHSTKLSTHFIVYFKRENQS